MNGRRNIFTQVSYDNSFIDYAVRLRPRRLMVEAITIDERCADSNIFASTRNTVCILKHLQRIGIKSYRQLCRQFET